MDLEQEAITPGQAAFNEWKESYSACALPVATTWEQLTVPGRTNWEKIGMAAVKAWQDMHHE